MTSATKCPHATASVEKAERKPHPYFEGSKCTWKLGGTEKSPHQHDEGVFDKFQGPLARVLPDILDHIGYTPLVQLNRIPQEAGIEADILCKCEFFNAGGSVKDRIGKRMVDDALASGRVKPGDTIIEPTSGNTGIGLALACAVRGLKMIVTMPEKMSQEKVDVLKALGAQIYRTPNSAAFDSPESHIGVAMRLNREIPNSHILDQYANPANPLAHYDGTAEEILKQTGGQVDMIVVGAGTGGTITGIAKKLKEKMPNVIVVGVDPHGSILAQPEALNSREGEGYQVEGIGYDFIPKVLDRSIVDRWVKSEDKESFVMARRMIREEGLLCGGSSGTNLSAALKAAKSLKKGQKCVVICPDSIRNYMTKHLSDHWMRDYGFYEAQTATSPTEWWSNNTVAELSIATPYTITPSVTVQQAIDILRNEGFDQLPVVSTDGDILGVVTIGNMSAKLLKGSCKPQDSVTKVIFKQFKQVSLTTALSELSSVFEKHHFALVVNSQKCFTDGNSHTEKTVIAGVVSSIDLLHYIAAGRKSEH